MSGKVPAAKAAQWVQVSEKYSPTDDLGVGLADEAFGPRVVVVGTRGQAAARQPEAQNRLAPRLVASGEKTVMETSISGITFLQAACRVFASADDHPAQRGQGGLQLTVRQVGHRCLGLQDRFRRRRPGWPAAFAASRPG